MKKLLAIIVLCFAPALLAAQEKPAEKQKDANCRFADSIEFHDDLRLMTLRITSAETAPQAPFETTIFYKRTGSHRIVLGSFVITKDTALPKNFNAKNDGKEYWAVYCGCDKRLLILDEVKK